MSNDQRSENRDTCAIDASIILSQLAEPVPCVLTDISERGARISVDAKVELPDVFVLALPVVDDLKDERLVQLRWKIGNTAGLRFGR